MTIKINKTLRIAYDELEFAFSKSSGPGGQKVNKSNTKVTLSWDLKRSRSLDQKTAKLLLEKLNLTSDGRLVLHSEKFRSQDRNKQNCIEKFKKVITKALYVPPKRVKTKPTKASKEKRLKEKKSRSELKKTRKNIKY